MHGYRPELEACALCTGAADASPLFSLAAGGVVCEHCAGDVPATEQLSPAGREWLRRLLGAKMADVVALEMPRAAAVDCFRAVRAFVAYHLPARLKALDFYAGTLTFVPDREEAW